MKNIKISKFIKHIKQSENGIAIRISSSAIASVIYFEAKKQQNSMIAFIPPTAENEKQS